MKIAVVLLLALAVSQAAEVRTSSRSTQTDDGKNEKRGVAEGNSAVQKRTPAISVTPTPNIEYVDTNESHQDKSPSQVFGARIRPATEQPPHDCDVLDTSTPSGQQIYATPVPPQVAKISDVVTQGHPFPAAIASHLYSPVSVYQARLGSPTTYEISAPVASQLAYSEHKIYQSAPQNSIQYFNAPLKLQNAGKSGNFIRLTAPYQQQQEQTNYLQPQTILYTQPQAQTPQQHQPQGHPQLIQYIPQIQYTQQQPQIPYPQPHQPQIQYTQPQITYTQNQAQQPLPYAQNPQAQYQQHQVYQNQQPQVIQLIPAQPELPFARLQQAQQTLLPKQQQLQSNALFVRIQQETANVEAQRHQPAQRELKTLQTPQTKVLEKQTLFAQQNYNEKPQGGAVSYASFSQGQPSANYISQNYIQPGVQYTPEPKPESKPINVAQIPNKPATQQQVQHQHYEQQQRSQQQNYEQQQRQKVQQQSYQPQEYQLQQQQLVYIKPNQLVPASQNYQPQVYQQSVYPEEQVLIQNPGYLQQEPVSAAPTFAPVQYFGKFAQSIFGSYQNQ